MLRGLALAIAVHLGVGLLLLFEFKQATDHAISREFEAIQMRTVTENELKQVMLNSRDRQRNSEQIIVQSDDKLQSDRSPEEYLSREKTYLSKHNNVVDHNTRAAKIGRFKNVLKEGLESEPQDSSDNRDQVAKNSRPKESEKNRAPESALGKNAERLKDTVQNLQALLTLPPQPEDLEQQTRLASKTGHTRGPASIDGPGSSSPAKKGDGESATDDYLENVAIGVNTLLNTKEFVFYSFYERIREKISNTWRSQLDSELDQIFARGENLGFDRKTKVQVELDNRGQLKGITVLGSSGFKELDNAAVEAFKLAAPFPNPPKGMLDASAKNVSIRWDFVVMADNSAPKIKMEFKRAPANF